jgi:hypothetical protein
MFTFPKDYMVSKIIHTYLVMRFSSSDFIDISHKIQNALKRYESHIIAERSYPALPFLIQVVSDYLQTRTLLCM